MSIGIENPEIITNVSFAKTDRRVRKHKKHLHKKVCEECNRTFKGGHGLNVHRALFHGMRARRGPRKQLELENGQIIFQTRDSKPIDANIS